MSVGKAIAKARAEKTPPLKQSDLAQKINEKPSVINGMHFISLTIADDRL
jgi:ribosome-binding protein aMBF1 (putative translation factor)